VLIQVYLQRCEALPDKVEILPNEPADERSSVEAQAVKCKLINTTCITRRQSECVIGNSARAPRIGTQIIRTF
jgi:hypothetical protein